MVLLCCTNAVTNIIFCFAIVILKVKLLRYIKDNRFIPIADDSAGVVEMDIQSKFSVDKDKKQLLLTECTNGNQSIPIGDHLQYTVIA